MRGSQCNMGSDERGATNVRKYVVARTQAYLLHYGTHMRPLSKLRVLFSEKISFVDCRFLTDKIMFWNRGVSNIA